MGHCGHPGRPCEPDLQASSDRSFPLANLLDAFLAHGLESWPEVEARVDSARDRRRDRRTSTRPGRAVLARWLNQEAPSPGSTPRPPLTRRPGKGLPRAWAPADHRPHRTRPAPPDG